MKVALARIIVSIGAVVGVLLLLRHRFAGTGQEMLAGWMSVAFSCTVVLGVLIFMRYGETRWYKRTSAFLNKYLTWAVMVLVLGVAVYLMWTQGR